MRLDVCALVQELGIENVFVLIYESGSFDATKAALRELDATLEGLHVKKSIMLSDISHADEITKQSTDHGWVTTPEGKTELRRIPFLASIRNRVFEPLEALTAQGEHFDTILFLNDVVLHQKTYCDYSTPMAETMQQPAPSTSRTHPPSTTPSPSETQAAMPP
jgi:hypothetical protein